MSRMAALISMAIVTPAVAADDPLALYWRKTSAEPRCQAAGADILVCGRRAADKYRVPFIVPTPGDPKTRGVPEERTALIAEQSPCEAKGPFLVACGMVGLGFSTKLGTGKVEYRPLAP